MGNINVLDIKVANLIAAGEVVDRPSSVIKELLENSLDAGATVITVETKKGGSELMRVTDNGCGMPKEDALICTKRHATSKIKNESDLNGILTLGFRGEALAAISAVAKVRIMTKQKNAPLGTLIRCDNGVVMESSETGCPDGTTVIVEELFASVPARRKFLKRDMVETMAIAAVVEKIALSRPDVSIRLICDGVMKFTSAGDNSLKNTIYSVLGREFSKKLIEVKWSTEGIEVTGFIGAPDNVRGNRNLQNFFINGRFIKSGTIQSALEQAFESYIPSDRFPCCVLYMFIHPALVDVNVHPAKLEVKFSSEQSVFNAVYCAVRNALTMNISRPTMKLPTDKQTDGDEAPENTGCDAAEVKKQASDIKLTNAFVPIDDRSERPKRSAEIPMLPEVTPEPSIPERQSVSDYRVTSASPPEGLVMMPGSGEVPDIPDRSADASIPREIPDIVPQEESESKQKPESDAADVPAKVERQNITPPKYRIAGEIFNSYVILELGDRVLIVDKHAAHERIIFEQMRANYLDSKVYAQVALVPVVVKLSGDELAALEAYRIDISATGFEFELDTKQSTASIIQYPADFDVRYVGEILLTMASRLAQGSGSAELTRRQNYEKALYTASCKAAIKAGEINAPEQIRWICDRLLALPDIKFCPHGRPVAMELTKSAIEHQFKRS